MESQPRPNQITIRFNCFLTAVLAFRSVVRAFDQADRSATHFDRLLDKLFPQHHWLSYLLLELAFWLIVVAGSLVIQQFWNRFVAGVWHVRQITLTESYALLLVFWFLFQ